MITWPAKYREIRAITPQDFKLKTQTFSSEITELVLKELKVAKNVSELNSIGLNIDLKKCLVT